MRRPRRCCAARAAPPPRCARTAQANADTEAYAIKARECSAGHAGLLRSFVDSHKPDDVNDLLSTEAGKEALRVAGRSGCQLLLGHTLQHCLHSRWRGKLIHDTFPTSHNTFSLSYFYHIIRLIVAIAINLVLVTAFAVYPPLLSNRRNNLPWNDELTHFTGLNVSLLVHYPWFKFALATASNLLLIALLLTIPTRGGLVIDLYFFDGFSWQTTPFQTMMLVWLVNALATKYREINALAQRKLDELGRDCELAGLSSCTLARRLPLTALRCSVWVSPPSRCLSFCAC